MIYLSGGIRKSFDAVLPENVGWMLQPWKGNHPMHHRWWGADNGRFAAPDAYTDEKYIGWLTKLLPYGHRCLFATAPDVVCDPVATWELSEPLLPVIRSIGYPAALVAQDGIENAAIVWESFDCLFIGGSTEWKLSEGAYALMREAKHRGKWVHMGRVNSFRRLVAASLSSVDSTDGTFLAFGPDRNLPRLVSWMEELERQPRLWTDLS